MTAARSLGGPLAVRSSAVDEDGADASFAGQHLTLLNVPSVDDVAAAVREIWWSANSDSAITYRQRVGLFTRPSVGVVVQSLLDPDVGRRDVHAEPDQRGRRAADRGELGARRGGRRRPRDPRQLPDGSRRAQCSSAHRASRRSRSVPPPTAAPSRRPSRRSWRRRCASTTSSSRELNAWPTVRGGLRAGARHRVGDRGRAAVPAAVPRRDAGQARRHSRRCGLARAGRSR